MFKRRLYFLGLAILALIIAGLMLLGCSTTTTQTGVLEGTVTIGPIFPVERLGEKPPVPPEVYAARKIMVYDRSGKNLIKQVDLSNNGTYRVELKPGTYLVDINHIGIDRSAEVPKTIQIKTGETVKLDIDIDTGIR